jgi:hypothetical protein
LHQRSRRSAADGTLSLHAGSLTSLLCRLLGGSEVHRHEETILPANVAIHSVVVYRPGISAIGIGGRSARDANHQDW